MIIQIQGKKNCKSKSSGQNYVSEKKIIGDKSIENCGFNNEIKILSFFHSSTKQKKASNTIFIIHDHLENFIFDAEGIQNESVRFFSNLLSPPP